ncbi:MAG: hypothetical protein ABTQ34_07460 [Bdellovibrionales bacterium]
MTLDDFKTHLDRVQTKLAAEQQSIVNYAVLPADMPREAYAFAYLRAERIAFKIINRRLEALSWMPIQLNPRFDAQDSRRESMKKWIKTELAGPPDACSFGNDLFHALARCGIAYGWDGAECSYTATRISTLLQDMACLVALMQYSIWLHEKGIAGMALTDPDNLSLCLCDIVSFIHTSALYNYLRSRDEEAERLRKMREYRQKKDMQARRSFLRLVDTASLAAEQDRA